MSTNNETERRAVRVPTRRLDRARAKEYHHTGRLRLGMPRRRLLLPTR